VVDGDTIDVTIDLGFDLYKKERVRVAGVDTPEKRTRDLDEKELGIDATNWMKEKLENGWTFGDVKDENLKTHPCMVSYSELPQLQRTKDFIFKAIVDSYK